MWPICLGTENNPERATIQFIADRMDMAVWRWVRAFVGKPDVVKKGVRLFLWPRQEAKKPLHDQLETTERLIKK